jgi:seryl-tRNA synthetase
MLRKSISYSPTINPNEINLKSNSIDYIYTQLASIITSFYYRLNLPIRVCLSPSYELLSYESLRLTIEVYLPSQIDYVRVGSVSLIDDYLARRLMIKHNSGDKSYVAMIHARVADVSQLSKCVLEASQTIGRGIKLPSILSTC